MENSAFLGKANELEKKANKQLKGTFFGNFMVSKADRADQAKELYGQAANCYKLANDLENALKCYMKCIECEESDADRAPHYREAANCMKETDIDQYVVFTQKAIDLYSLAGRASTGATMAKDCAQNMEEQYSYEQAISMYEKAARLYEMDNQTTQSSQMALKACELIIMSKQWDKLETIIKNYKKIAKKYLAVPILKTSAKDLEFMHCLCFLAMEDKVGAKQSMNASTIDDPHFDGSREHDLLQNMIQAIEDNDKDSFTMQISQYNQITSMNKSKTSLLVKIKEHYFPEQESQFALAGEIDFTGA